MDTKLEEVKKEEIKREENLQEALKRQKFIQEQQKRENEYEGSLIKSELHKIDKYQS
jgi:hypothetical protein